ncbi:MAG TPA: TetR/AcrR family transcriptional regulator C-terminal domain-containing protein, partial [Kribbella sp.]|nr:TetR/AcrR family transcriptional regulator C-terminal domain-containing protein [Kribbella sp.]
EFIARRNWDVLTAHPWIHEVPTMRTALGPNITRKYEIELRPLDGLGLTDVERASALSLVLTHVQGTARAGAEQLRTQRESGLSDEEWWRQISPTLTTVMTGSHFPLAGRVGTAVGEHFQSALDPAHALTFGLTMILDGLGGLIGSRSAVE